MADEYQGATEGMAPGQIAGAPDITGAGSDTGVSGAGRPRSLDEAFRLLNTDNAGGAEESVQSDDGPVELGTAEDQADAGADGGSATADAPDPVQAQSSGTQATAPASSGGTARAYGVNDVLQALAQQAIDQAQRDFADKGVGRISINDLYHRDENTGRVTFEDIDNPGRSFNSRVEAQAFVDAYNKSLDDELKLYANDVYKSLKENNKDVIALIEFNDTYQKMPPAVRQAFEALIAPFEQTNANGQIVFPGVDFNRTYQQAMNLVALQGQQRTQQQQQQQAAQQQPPQAVSKTPAVDLKSGSGASSDDYKTPPRNIGEALKRVNEMKKKGKK